MPREPLTRDAFREGVFARDRHRCVVCPAPAQDAHHILERRLFPDGGYYLDNGVSLCSPHHREAEATTLSCESLRAAAGIERVILPPHLYPERRYDKWGNPVRADGRRLRGELFFEEPAQKVLAPVLRSFVPRAEEPRAPYMSWSAGAAASGFVLEPQALAGVEVVALAEADGEVVSVDAAGLYVGTGETVEPPAAARELPLMVAELLPPGGRVTGSFRGETFHLAAAWDGRDVCLAWDETALLGELLGLPVAATLARGRFDVAGLRALVTLGRHRVRRADAFAYAAYRRSVARVVVDPSGASG